MAFFLSRICLCDPSCHIFYDCCPDAIQQNLVSQLGYDAEQILKLSGCKKNKKRQKLYYSQVYVVEECPEEYSDKELATQCHVEMPGADVLAATWVSGLKSGLIFKNIFCAACNGAAIPGGIEDVVFWTTDLECIPDTVLRRTFVLRQSSISAVLREACVDRMDYYFLQMLRPWPHFCKNHKSSCDPMWSTDFTSDMCKNYTSMVYQTVYPNQVTFKNEHCAACNFRKRVGCADNQGLSGTQIYFQNYPPTASRH